MAGYDQDARSRARTTMGPATRRGTSERGAAAGTDPGSGDVVAWSSPSYIRARIRQGQVAQNVFVKNRETGARESPKEETKRAMVRSKTSRSTQTQTPRVDRPTSLDLGSFGTVHSMSMETVEFLTGILEGRRQELLDEEKSTEGGPNDQATEVYARLQPHLSVQAAETEDEDRARHPSTFMRRFGQEESDNAVRLTRSRSYEALVRLEHVLEERHRHLMAGGVIDPSPSPPQPGLSTESLFEEISRLQHSIGGSGSRMLSKATN